MLGVGEIRCCDKRLRQWAVCVTFSASPKTVTHAWRNAAFGAALYVYVVRRTVAAGDVRWTAVRKERRQRPSDESRPQPGWPRSSAWSEAALGVPATQAGYDDTLVVREKSVRRRECAGAERSANSERKPER